VPMDAFTAADPSGYGAPSDPPEPFNPRWIDLPELSAGETDDLGTIVLED